MPFTTSGFAGIVTIAGSPIAVGLTGTAQTHGTENGLARYKVPFSGRDRRRSSAYSFARAFFLPPADSCLRACVVHLSKIFVSSSALPS